MRVAIIGLGSIAERAYLPVLATRADVEPVLCTRNADRLRQLSNAYGHPRLRGQADRLHGR